MRSTCLLSSNLLNEVGLSFFRYFEVGLRVCDIVVKKFTFAISSLEEFLFFLSVSHFCSHSCCRQNFSLSCGRISWNLVNGFNFAQFLKIWIVFLRCGDVFHDGTGTVILDYDSVVPWSSGSAPDFYRATLLKSAVYAMLCLFERQSICHIGDRCQNGFGLSILHRHQHYS